MNNNSPSGNDPHYRLIDVDGTVIATFRYAIDMDAFYLSEVSRPRYVGQVFNQGRQEWITYILDSYNLYEEES